MRKTPPVTSGCAQSERVSTFRYICVAGCNIISGGCLSETPCGLNTGIIMVGLVKNSRLLLPQKGGSCYAIPEQAIEFLFFY